ncbi:cytochrome c oxidase subunit II [Qipengyuania sp. YG27]|uniref:Cytochrome aa3 subunit 2 n=1 Tax=Qipengyuania mesophila TaxID=2867246 RepID=A0ABS7JS32_9SPHN|nr:cytochrome c oxidase subunit II [Qipengyuania mesophila]MBX7500406.1 cytochrome c oxidase subunit II [Qipengyuania mesophila]
MIGKAPLSYMADGGSRSALALQSLAWGFTAISVAVIIIIAVLIALAIRRSRARAKTALLQDVARDGDGLALIWWGVGLSLPVLVAMAIWNFLTTRLLAEQPSDPALTVQVTGHRWWWDIRYQLDGLEIATANELVIPVGTPVLLQLSSGDVIHDFWVPKLGPKMDMIPGRTNQTWLQADVAGTYLGQCAEYCGLEHARMAFTVHAVPPGQFREWVAREVLPAAGTTAAFDNAAPSNAAAASQSSTPASENPDALLAAQTAQALFESRCGACHTARGTAAGGIIGPDLTHFASRRTIAAGWMPNTPANLDRWLTNPQAIKPGVDMPRVQLTPNERKRIVTWLEGLE